VKHWCNLFKTNPNPQTVQNISFYRAENQLHLPKKDEAVNEIREKNRCYCEYHVNPLDLELDI